MKLQEIKILNRDEFAKFIFNQNTKIKNYNFDLFHDIAKIVNFAYDSNNYRNEFKEIISDKPVKKEYNFYVKSLGSWLFDKENISSIKHIEKDSDYLNKYEITIIPNCDYLYNTEFATIKKIK